MRVIGGRDYYDSASAYGIDTEVVFVRSPRQLTVGEFRKIKWKPSEKIAIMKATDLDKKWGNYPSVSERGTLGKTQIQISYHPVIFCGVVYTGILIETNDINVYPPEKHFFWHKEKLDAFLAERGWKLCKSSVSYANKDCRPLFEPAILKGESLTALLDLRIAIAYPTFSENKYRTLRDDEDSRWAINGDGLKDVEFQRAIDPVTAFQQLAQWVGGTLANVGPDIVEITDDNVKLAKHGMDKWSFRKHKLDKKK